MALATTTSHAQRYRSLFPDILAPDKVYLESFRQLPHPRAYQQRRALSDGDIQYKASQDQDNQLIQRSDLSLSAHPENFYTTNSYYDDLTTDSGSQSDVSNGPTTPTSPSPPSLPDSLHSVGYSSFSDEGSSSNSKTHRYVPIRSATTPPAVLSQMHLYSFQKVAYCPRCLFWLNPEWAEADSLIKFIDFVDPCRQGLNEEGLDREGHLRINSKCCPICERERHIVKSSPDADEEDFLMEQLDEIIEVWTRRGLIKGMTEEARNIKESMIVVEKRVRRSKAKKGAFAASLAEKGSKKAREMGLPPGLWDAMEIGFELAAELLEGLGDL